MGLSSSLNAGVMGLAVNATKLGTISDNIANSETYGYKRVDTEFTNLVLQQGNGAYTAGGVRVTTFKDVAAQGALISTTTVQTFPWPDEVCSRSRQLAASVNPPATGRSCSQRLAHLRRTKTGIYARKPALFCLDGQPTPMAP